MDLSQPLSSIAPSLEAETLTVLARSETPLTGRRVTEMARRGSHPAIGKVLDRLVRHGLVDMQHAGNANLYRLNREHLLAPTILAAADATATLRSRLREAIAQWPVPCVHASLYGSAARGEAGPESDIDVLIVRSPRDADSDGWMQQLDRLENAVWLWTGNHLSWFETTLPDLARAANANEPILDSWRADAITLVGEPITRLLAAQPGPVG